MKKIVLCLALFSLLVAPAFAGTKPQTKKDKFSYSLGVYFGKRLVNQKGKLSNEVFYKGLRDALEEKKLEMTQVEIQLTLMSARQEEQKKRKATRMKVASKNQKEGEEFLAANKGRSGIISLANGIQYKVITAGTGAQPEKKSKVTVHYKGALITGKVFDSSYKRKKPATFALNRVIKGWQEILPLMKKGAKWKVFIPSKLGYGSRGAGGIIPPHATLVFDIELLNIK
ncbi:MAG: FKBP-type peptidyl-prolyl cis-trans isomerase FklB [bacterium]|jgi:FKBP-type peptidyl-prolyl cis-trans isomerase FklB